MFAWACQPRGADLCPDWVMARSPFSFEGLPKGRTGPLPREGDERIIPNRNPAFERSLSPDFRKVPLHSASEASTFSEPEAPCRPVPAPAHTRPLEPGQNLCEEGAEAAGALGLGSSSPGSVPGSASCFTCLTPVSPPEKCDIVMRME